MRLSEIVTESQLEEGPILNKIGTAVGNAVGTAAKGVGAVAGGIAGLGSAVKKGFQAGKATVGQGGDAPADTTAPQPAAAAPAAPSGPSAMGALAGALGKKAYKGATGYNLPSDDAGNKKVAAGNAAVAAQAEPAAGAEPQATAAPAQQQAAPAAAGAPAAPAQQQAAPAAAPKAAANDSAFSKAQKAIAGLPPEQQKQIMGLLQSDPKVKAAMSGKGAAPKPNPAGAGAGAFGQMANNLKAGASKPAAPAPQAAAPSGTPMPTNPIQVPGAGTNPNPTAPTQQQAAPAAAPAQPAAAPAAAPGDEGKPGFLQSKIKGRRGPAAPDQATIDADRERMMGNFTDSVERHKQRMVAESIKNGTSSLFRKK